MVMCDIKFSFGMLWVCWKQLLSVTFKWNRQPMHDYEMGIPLKKCISQSLSILECDISLKSIATKKKSRMGGIKGASEFE